MKNIDLIVKSIFLFVNTFALAFVIVVVRIALKKMDAKFDYVLNKLKYVKERNDAAYLNMLCQIQIYLIKNEEYEKAAEMKKIIEEEFKQLESEKKNETK